MKKKILVTGKNGQVGRALVQAMKPYKNELVFMDREELDITDEEKINHIIEKNHFSGIINTAAYTAVDKAENDEKNCYKVNSDGVLFLSKACAKKRMWLIHYSSDYVYHPDHNEILNELENTNPRGIYAKSKLLGEKYAVENNPQTIIIRTSWVYDETGKNFVNTMKNLTRNRDELSVVEDQIGSPTYAKDIAEITLRFVERIEQGKPEWGIYNFSNEGFISWYHFAKKINELEGNSCTIKGIPSSAYPTPAPRPHNSKMSKEKISHQLDIIPRNWEIALKECLNKEKKD